MIFVNLISWVVSFILWLPCPHEKIPLYQLNRMLGVPQSWSEHSGDGRIPASAGDWVLLVQCPILAHLILCLYCLTGLWIWTKWQPIQTCIGSLSCISGWCQIWIVFCVWIRSNYSYSSSPKFWWSYYLCWWSLWWYISLF